MTEFRTRVRAHHVLGVRRLYSCAAVLLTLAAGESLAQSSTAETSVQVAKSFHATRTNTPPEIDGVLDDSVWAAREPITDLHQINPVEYAEPTKLTEVWITYDRDFIYVAAQLHDDEPELISARQLVQGRGFGFDDLFTVWLDTFHDHRNSYMFQMNPNGIRLDALQGNDYFISDWDGIWQGEARINERGWALEMAIPFKTLSFDPDNEVWGINFARWLARDRENSGWSSQERRIIPAHSGDLQGLVGMEQGVGLDIVPSLVAREAENRNTDTKTSDLEPSLDAFYRFDTGLTGALTLNTDFSATEVDNRQVNLSRFNLFFPEKRDFFLQDAAIFQFANVNRNGRPFFSRTIGLADNGQPVDINVGAKLTGRTGPWSVGALAVNQDSADGAPDKTDLFVGRLSYNLAAESTLGMIATYGSPVAGDENSLLGADYYYRNSEVFDNKTVEGRLWAQQSSTPGLVGQDSAWGAEIGYPNDRIAGSLRVTEIQENFNPELGFVNRGGIRDYQIFGRYRTRPEESRWRAINHWAFGSWKYDPAGQLESRFLDLSWGELVSHQGDAFALSTFPQYERITEPFEIVDGLIVPPGIYEYTRNQFRLSTGNQRKISGWLRIGVGDYYNGERTFANLGFNWRPSENFRFGLNYTQNDLEFPDGRFITRIYGINADLAFNSRWSWLNLVQFDNVSNRLSINSRLRFVPKAGQELYFVLNHGKLRDLEHHSRYTTEFEEFVIKASYTFRF